MLSSISSLSSLYATDPTQFSQARPAAQQKSETPQDTVQLSQAAKAAMGDPDHDGD